MLDALLETLLWEKAICAFTTTLQGVIFWQILFCAASTAGKQREREENHAAAIVHAVNLLKSPACVKFIANVSHASSPRMRLAS